MREREKKKETFSNIRYPTISIWPPFAVPEAKAPSSIERPTSAFWRLGLCHDGVVDEREEERHVLILVIRLYESGYCCGPLGKTLTVTALAIIYPNSINGDLVERKVGRDNLSLIVGDFAW